MRLVVASRHDSAARALVERWGAQRAALATPVDLSRPGWRHDVGSPDGDAAVVGDRVVPAEALEAVVVRLAAVPEPELAVVRPEDRGYAAAEMTAFLLAWLDARTCPVVNRPTPGCLNGPAWPPERWALGAARAGLEILPVRRRVPGGPPHPSAAPGEVTAIVVGDRCLGGVHPRLATKARRLAADAGVALLAVRFAGSGPDATFLGAHAWPDLADPAVADALDTHLEAAC